MADKGQTGFADTAELRKGAVHDEGRPNVEEEEEQQEARETNGRHLRHNGHRTARSANSSSVSAQDENVEMAEEETDEGELTEDRESASEQGNQGRTKKTRGGTHDQHVTAGKKGGSRIRELIELGYKYEEEHGIGPGRNPRSKLTRIRPEKKSHENPEDAES